MFFFSKKRTNMGKKTDTFAFLVSIRLQNGMQYIFCKYSVYLYKRTEQQLNRYVQ